MKDNIKGLTPKSMSTTPWESRVDSVKAIRFQLTYIREALFELAEKDGDIKTHSEADTLAIKEISDFGFLVSFVIWYQIPDAVNVAIKKLQSKEMVLNVAIKVKILIKFFKEFREVGLSEAIEVAKGFAIEMSVDPVFPQRRLILRKNNLTTSREQEVLFSAEENFKVNYFLSVVDQVIASLDTRFEHYNEYGNFMKELAGKDLMSCCILLQDALKYVEASNIDAKKLYVKLTLMDTYLPNEIITNIDALKFVKADHYSNALVAYRVLLTIPVIVASAERSFSKLKLLKSYLRSTMSQ